MQRYVLGKGTQRHEDIYEQNTHPFVMGRPAKFSRTAKRLKNLGRCAASAAIGSSSTNVNNLTFRSVREVLVEPAVCLNGFGRMHAPLAAKSRMPNLGPLFCLAGTIRMTPEIKTCHSKEWDVAVAGRDRAPHLPIPVEQYLPPVFYTSSHACLPSIGRGKCFM